MVQLAHRFPLPLPGPKHTRYSTAVFVHGVKVALPDIPTRNGVVHIITRLLNPLKKDHGPPNHPPKEDTWTGAFAFGEEQEEQEDEWAGWEEWLPRWADED